jgi:hypothetical protein
VSVKTKFVIYYYYNKIIVMDLLIFKIIVVDLDEWVNEMIDEFMANNNNNTLTKALVTSRTASLIERYCEEMVYQYEGVDGEYLKI